MKVVYQQHIFSHYRQGIIDCMLADREHEFHLVGDTEDPYRGGIRSAAIRDPARFARVPSVVYPGGLLRQPGLGRALHQVHPDCVIFCGDPHFVNVWHQAARMRRRGKMVLFWTHGWLARPTGYVGRIRRRFYRLADGLLLYGDRAKAIGVSEGFDPKRMHVIYNSLDYEHQSNIRRRVTSAELVSARRELFGEASAPIVICCARLTANRGLDMLLESLRGLRARGHRLHCLLVGDGPKRSELDAYSREHGLSVLFYGPCYSEEELARLFMMSHVCVSPGWIGLTAVHSLTYGTPVITHDNANEQGPEWEAITDGETGALFRQHDVSHLSEKLLAWTTDNAQTPRVRERCWTVIARHYNVAYQKRVLSRALSGLPAEDSVWERWVDRI